MKSAAQLEKNILSLPPAQRAQMALAAWESLQGDAAAEADHGLDPAGIALAIERDQQAEAGTAKLLSHSVFRRLTGGLDT